jgi:hypothetical protein
VSGSMLQSMGPELLYAILINVILAISLPEHSKQFVYGGCAV